MPTTFTPTYLSLGANLGDDPPANLERARAALASLPDVAPGACSPIYRTEPQGLKEQPWFANQVMRLDCGPSWTPLRLLKALLDMERQMGRVREQDQGPRHIDLDLLLFGRDCQDSPELTLPHPRMKQRAFVLVPLHDIAPQLVFPDGTSLATTLQTLHFTVSGNRIWQES